MKQPNIWVISDTHFDTPENPSGIVRRGIRPPNHTALTLEGLERLNPQDILIHLGDVIDKEEDRLAGFMDQCPARTKILCLGNHDKHSVHWYLRNGFSAVMETFTLKYGGETILFSHVPMMVRRWDRPWKGRRGVVLPVDGIDLNIHGHLHLRNHRDEESAWQNEEDDSWFLFSLEAIGYHPVKLDDILNKKVTRVYKRDALKHVYAHDKVNFDPIPKS
jgi:calcineurin-like phosphoesterase family protein